MVLTVDDLRGHTRDLLSSRFAGEFQKLPAVKAWFDSEKYQGLENARDHIEAVLQVSLLDIRDKILGDAVVFALRLPADAPIDPSQAQGVLAAQSGRPGFAQTADRPGEYNPEAKWRHRLDRRAQAGRSLVFRSRVSRRLGPAGRGLRDLRRWHVCSLEFGKLGQGCHRPQGRPTSASPDTLASLAELTRFQTLDRQLPEQALARLFVDARLVERLFKNATQQKPPGEERHIALVERWLDALQYAGATLTATDGRLVLHTAKTFDPRKLDELLGPASTDSAPVAPRLDHVPATALAVGSIQVDFASLYQTIIQLVPEPDRPRLANFETAVSGIFLGEDLRTRILPGLGPRAMAYLDAPADWSSATSPTPGHWPFPTVLAVELGADREPRSSSVRPDRAGSGRHGRRV